MKILIQRAYFITALLLLLCLNSFAGKGLIDFVECQVDLKKDGSCVICYTVRYRVVEGELHGFYFSGNDKLSITGFSDRSYAVDDAGNNYGLDITYIYYVIVF